MKLRPRSLAIDVAVGLGVRVAVARQHDLRPHGLDRLDLDLGRGLRHHDDGLQTEVSGRVGHALGVVAGAGSDDAPRLLLRTQVGDAVVGPPQLEAEDGLEVLALEQHPRAETTRQARGVLERRLPGHVVDAAREHVVQKRRIGGRTGHGGQG